MKQLIAKKIMKADVKATDVPALFNEEQVEYHHIDTVNWPEYPYCPQVEFAIAHTHEALLLHYRVTEDSVAAVAGVDNGRVWEDACVEFFSIPANDGVYYNIECNCVGNLLIGGGAQRTGRTHAPQAVIDTVDRWCSLGREGFTERIGTCSWEVALVIPYSAFYLHKLTRMDGTTFRANFYKCGDKLQTPHFLSWNPIELEKPCFHSPQFFAEVVME